MLERTRRSLLAGLVGIALAGGLAAAPAMAAEKKLNVVATTGMVADAVRSVGGEHVDVHALLGPGVDPHLYRQTSSDIAAATRADVVFWQGLHLEAQLQEFLERLGQRKTVIALGEQLPRDRLLKNDQNAALPDPHVWFDPHLWKGVVTAARDELIRLRPEARADFEAGAQAYLAEIDRVADYAAKVLASVPAQSRILVTAHDAFNYFGRAYGYEVRGIQGISTESEAGLKQVEDLVQLIVDRGIGAIFIESSVSDRNVKALVEGAAAKGHKVVIGGELFSDAAGEAGTYEGTYVGMIDHNVTIIARALGGEAPETGMDGKLTVR
ncbi:metal ABC transporter solute-binding protein, Zn/Mn family [Pseudochelatococcus lubricantis]|uniref:metal ABC transporter solute-binding protein, Zn/Mn family n=1 Tax=Pseudochelatococcus lubricantis TaxID=1538102 RepID=UPI0035E79D81